MIFGYDKILEIHEQAIKSGLHKKRDLMLGGISSDYVARLENTGSPDEILKLNLQTMNRDVSIIDERGVRQVPLERWLRNAAYDTRLFSETNYFKDLAEEAKAAADSPAQERPRPDIAPNTTSGPANRPVPPAVAGENDPPAVRIRDIAITLSPLLVLGAAVVIRFTSIKGWQVLAPIALAQAIWMIFRLWNTPPSELADVTDGRAVIARQFESLPQAGILLVILSIAASGLVQLNW